MITFSLVESWTQEEGIKYRFFAEVGGWFPEGLMNRGDPTILQVPLCSDHPCNDKS